MCCDNDTCCCLDLLIEKKMNCVQKFQPSVYYICRDFEADFESVMDREHEANMWRTAWKEVSAMCDEYCCLTQDNEECKLLKWLETEIHGSNLNELTAKQKEYLQKENLEKDVFQLVGGPSQLQEHKKLKNGASITHVHMQHKFNAFGCRNCGKVVILPNMMTNANDDEIVWWKNTTEHVARKLMMRQEMW